MAASVCRTCASQFRFKAFNFVQVSKSIQRRLSTPISASVSPCQVLSLSRKRDPVVPSYNLNGHELMNVNDITLLGVVISHNLSWAHQMRIFSGIQPTGVPHIGNYLGAIKQWKDLQEQHRHVMYSIVDLHSIALPQDPKQLKTSILTTTAILLACGIDPERSILFQQSAVKEHAELAWVLGCKITLARLNSFTQWKAKVGSDKKKACVGLFTYPVLQSADILLYKSTHVPVGDDQKQHLEMAQEVARIFNNNYGEFFPIPKPIFGNVTKVKSLRDPTIKMSKSDDQMLSRIELLDTHDQIVKKLKKAVTDFTSEVTYDPQSRPGVSNIVMIHSAVSGKTVEDICNEVKGLETAEYKLVVAEAVNAFIEPIRYKVSSLLQDKEYLQDVLKTGADKAREIAEKNYNDVKQLVGFI